MALLFQVINFDGTEKYDFTNAASKVRLISGSVQDMTSEIGEPVEFRFQTISKGTPTEIREAIAEVEIIFKRATNFFSDLTSQNSIWIHTQTDAAKARRALVMSWTREDTSQQNSDPLLDKTEMVISNWTIVRKGFWEAVTADIFAPTLPTTKLRAGACGVDPWATLALGVAPISTQSSISRGTAPGRIQKIQLELDTVYTDKAWEKLWWGMKLVEALPTPASYYKAFQQYDDLDGEEYDSDVNLLFSNADALNGICCQITFSGSDAFANKVGAPVPDWATDVDNKSGTYLVLMRMRSSTAAGSFRAAMFQSWNDIDNVGSIADTFQDVFVEDDDFHLYEMGVVQVPPEPYRSARRLGGAALGNIRIGLAAERLSVGGYLEVDYFIFIPQEYAVSLSNTRLADNRYMQILTDEEDYVFSFTTKTTGGWEVFVHEMSESNWRWPADPDKYLIVVMAADIAIGDGHHPQNEPLGAFSTIQVYPRYFSYNAD